MEQIQPDNVVERCPMDKWFVVHVLSGHEQKVRNAIERKMLIDKCNYGVNGIIIAQEEVVEVKHGKKTSRKKKFFPGYILVNMELYDEGNKINVENWQMINGTNGIIGFLGGDRARALTKMEFNEIYSQMNGEEQTIGPKIDFELNDTVMIKDGAFTGLEGVVSAIDPQTGKIKLLVSIFGRSTPVELEYWQVTR